MKKLLVLALLGPLLGGCAAFQKLQAIFEIATTATVSPGTAYIAISSFEVLEAAATQYFVYCHKTPADAACDPGTVAQPGPLRIAIKADKAGRLARDQIKTAGKTGALISVTTYNLLTQAVNDLSSNSQLVAFGATK